MNRKYVSRVRYDGKMRIEMVDSASVVKDSGVELSTQLLPMVFRDEVGNFHTDGFTAFAIIGNHPMKRYSYILPSGVVLYNMRALYNMAMDMSVENSVIGTYRIGIMDDYFKIAGMVYGNEVQAKIGKRKGAGDVGQG